MTACFSTLLWSVGLRVNGCIVSGPEDWARVVIVSGPEDWARVVMSTISGQQG